MERDDDNAAAVSWTEKIQAITTIAAFPLILRAYYGSRCANWLTSYADSDTIGWTFDMNTGTITSQEDSYTSNILKEWDNDSDDGQERELSIPVILGNQASTNQFDDNGTVLTIESDASGWSSSSSEMPNVARMMRKMQRLMTSDNLSPEDKQAMKDLLDGKGPSEASESEPDPDADDTDTNDGNPAPKDTTDHTGKSAPTESGPGP